MIPYFRQLYPIHNLNKVSGFINNTIDESKHIVDNASDIVKDIESLIYRAYTSKKKNSPLVYTDETNIDGYNCETFTFKSNKVIQVFDCDCQLDIKIINITDDIEFNELKTLCQKFCNINITRYKYPSQYGNTHSVSKIEFVLSGVVILNNLIMCPYMSSEITHEVRHSFIFYRKFFDKTYEESVSMDMKSQDWDKLYKFCENYIRKYNSKDTKYLSYEEENYFIIYSLYSCDVEEIDAFTQSAYDEMTNVKSVNLVKSKLKETDLWNTIILLKEMIDKFSDNFKDRYTIFNSTICNNQLPTYGIYKKLIERRYKTLCRNYGIVQMLLIDNCEDDLIAEKYSYYSIIRKGFYVNNSKYYV